MATPNDQQERAIADLEHSIYTLAHLAMLNARRQIRLARDTDETPEVIADLCADMHEAGAIINLLER